MTTIAETSLDAISEDVAQPRPRLSLALEALQGRERNRYGTDVFLNEFSEPGDFGRLAEGLARGLCDLEKDCAFYFAASLVLALENELLPARPEWVAFCRAAGRIVDSPSQAVR